MIMTKIITFSPWKHAKHAKINVILHFYILNVNDFCFLCFKWFTCIFTLHFRCTLENREIHFITLAQFAINFPLFASDEHRFRRCKSDSDYNYVPYSYHPTLKDLEESLRPRSTILTKAFFSIAYGLQGPPKSLKSQDQGSRDGSKIREDEDDP